MSRYVPPHRKRQDKENGGSADNGNGSRDTDEGWQREAWQALSHSITGIINRVSADNVQHSATELFRENIIRGRGLLCRSLMRAQSADPDLTNVFAALVSCVNKELSVIGLLLSKRLVVQWRRLRRRKDWTMLRCVSRFIAWLYIFNIINVDIIYQIILAHLTAEPRTDDDIDQAAALFRETFRAMSQRAVADFHAHVLTPIRDLLAMDNEEWRLSPRAQALLEACLVEVQQWERVKFVETVIPTHLLLVDPNEQKCHEVDLDDTNDAEAEEKLDRFAHDGDYEAHEAAYEKTRCAILGDNWETELLERIVAEDEMHEEMEEQEVEEQEAEEAPKQLIDEKERQIRRDVYMAMRSSVRADEVVHKIIKGMQPQTERSICFMVIEGCCEEASYRKVYGMVAERLCKSNSRFQNFFIEAFRLRYTHAEDLEEKQIKFTCKIYSHLLRTYSLPWHKCLCVLDVVESNLSQRLVIQWVMQGLVEAMGIRAVGEQFAGDKELRSNTRKLFPVPPQASEAALERAVNMFEAMGIGELASETRQHLEGLRRSKPTNYKGDYGMDGDGSKKRSREHMLEYV
ncbi:MA3 domain [Trypanosoma vivax]|uniref:MI domain-containing protein n=1 Tax=Trypanosoma vivax (strain Y486) TaxID=1055687 RepID=G0UCX2_TRYVY|nr:hypothetical protein TRVL_01366 [Trypanosoma vivax]KAH8607986.1 MA3 domain [Trypanosoma vivax]CCC53682.1 conserved hypothetical protein [Trypanosoma vivax Y486]